MKTKRQNLVAKAIRIISGCFLGLTLFIGLILLLNLSNSISQPAIAASIKATSLIPPSSTPTPRPIPNHSTKSSEAMYFDSTEELTLLTGNGQILFDSPESPDQSIEIFMMNSNGNNIRKLTSGSGKSFDGRFSPDGTKIAFSSDRSGSWHVYTMNIDGTNIQQLAPGGLPDWSPNGRYIIYTCSFDGGICVMDANGANIRQLISSGGSFPKWSPRGKKIAFMSDQSGDWEISVINADGTGLTRLTHNPDTDDVLPDWSPDGSKIAFIRQRQTSSRYVDDIYVMNSDGSNVHRIVAGDAERDYFGPLVWSPDGTKIAFYAHVNTSETSSIHVMNADGSNVTRLTERKSFPTDWDHAIADRTRDTDNDGLSDLEEKSGWRNDSGGPFHTDPFNEDTDGDNLNDGIEKLGNTNPLSSNTDGDGLGDNEEDKNRNGRVDFGETDPTLKDTDRDGLWDGDDPGPYVVDNRKALAIYLTDFKDSKSMSLPYSAADMRNSLEWLGFQVTDLYDSPNDGVRYSYDEISEVIENFQDSLDPDDVVVVYITTHGWNIGDLYFITYGDGPHREGKLRSQLETLGSSLDFLFLHTCKGWYFEDEAQNIGNGLIFFGKDGNSFEQLPEIAFYETIAGATLQQNDGYYWQPHYRRDQAQRTIESTLDNINRVDRGGKATGKWVMYDSDPENDFDLLSPNLQPQLMSALAHVQSFNASPSTTITPTAYLTSTGFTTFDSDSDGITDAITLTWQAHTTLPEEEIILVASLSDTEGDRFQQQLLGPLTIYGQSQSTQTLQFYAPYSGTYNVNLFLYSLPWELSDLQQFPNIPLESGPGPSGGAERFKNVQLDPDSNFSAGSTITVTWAMTTTAPNESVRVVGKLGTNPFALDAISVTMSSGLVPVSASSPATGVLTLTLPTDELWYLDLYGLDSVGRVEDVHTLHLWATDTYTDTTVDTNSDGLSEFLEILVDINPPQEGVYEFSGRLVDKTGNPVASTTVTKTLAASSETIALRFSGSQIRRGRRNGPYQLHDVRLNGLQAGMTEDWIGESVYTTDVYSYTQFVTPTVALIGTPIEQAVDTNGNGLFNTIPVTWTVEVGQPGTYTLSAWLADLQGEMIDYQTISRELSPGLNNLVIRFDAVNDN